MQRRFLFFGTGYFIQVTFGFLKRFFASAILWDYILIDSGLYTVWNLGLGVSSIRCWLKNVKHCQTQKADSSQWNCNCSKNMGINWRFVLKRVFFTFLFISKFCVSWNAPGKTATTWRRVAWLLEFTIFHKKSGMSWENLWSWVYVAGHFAKDL